MSLSKAQIITQVNRFNPQYALPRNIRELVDLLNYLVARHHAGIEPCNDGQPVRYIDARKRLTNEHQLHEDHKDGVAQGQPDCGPDEFWDDDNSLDSLGGDGNLAATTAVGFDSGTGSALGSAKVDKQIAAKLAQGTQPHKAWTDSKAIIVWEQLARMFLLWQWDPTRIADFFAFLRYDQLLLLSENSHPELASMKAVFRMVTRPKEIETAYRPFLAITGFVDQTTSVATAARVAVAGDVSQAVSLRKVMAIYLCLENNHLPFSDLFYFSGEGWVVEKAKTHTLGTKPLGVPTRPVEFSPPQVSPYQSPQKQHRTEDAEIFRGDPARATPKSLSIALTAAIKAGLLTPEQMAGRCLACLKAPADHRYQLCPRPAGDFDKHLPLKAIIRAAAEKRF